MSQRHPTPIAPAPSGTANEVAWFRQTAKNIKERGVSVGPGLRASYTTEGTLIELGKIAVESTTAAEPAQIKRALLLAYGNGSYFTAQAFDDSGSLAGDIIYVAVPIYLRASTYNARNVSGMPFRPLSEGWRASPANRSDAYVNITVFPQYAVGDEVYIFKPQGKTDVVIPRGIVPDTNSDYTVEWMDANVEGRHLETALVEVPICRIESGQVVQRHILVRGGPIY